MKKIPLTLGKFAIVDDADFESLSKFKWHTKKETTGDFYARRWTRQGAVYMHREMLGLTDPKIFCDHINHDGLDNRRVNLRAVTRQQNMRNQRGAHRNSSSGIRGVYFIARSGKWKAIITINGVQKNLGHFANIEEAKEAYATANRAHFGEFGGYAESVAGWRSNGE